jgi:acyl-coenzyme A thioesterase PaaI-like protein
LTNPAGNVLGGFQAAMLWETVGAALLATLEPDQFQSTTQMTVNFMRPVRPGRITGKGRVVHREGDLVFREASLIERRPSDRDRQRHGAGESPRPGARRRVI